MIKQLSYRCWYWIGMRCRFFSEYSYICNKAMNNAYDMLKQAMTPQLRTMIKDGWCNECGNYNGDGDE